MRRLRPGLQCIALLGAAALAATALRAAQDLPDVERQVQGLMVEALIDRAAGGDPVAQFQLGGLYSRGDGVTQDDAAAARWWRLAAEQGFAEAQNELGTVLSEGIGVEADAAEAMRWFTLAAEQGLAVAQANVAAMYRLGKGVRRNDRLAVEWDRRAAEQGMGWAQYYLGEAYAEARGVRRDVMQAAQWYRRAADQGYTDALFKLGVLYRGNSIAIPVLDSAILEAYGEYWVARAAQQGSQEADIWLERRMESNTFCRLTMRIASGAIRVRPEPDADILHEARDEPACVLQKPGRTIAPLKDWSAVYLHEPKVTGFIRQADLSRR